MLCSFSHQIRSFEEYLTFQATNKSELEAQRAYENILSAGRSEFNVSGFCVACGKVVPLKVDLMWGDGVRPNWRERLQCTCGLNNRIRAALGFLNELTGDKHDPAFYATEQVTPLFSQLRRRHPTLIGSEYLRDGTERGLTNSKGIRHEDITKLTFASGSLDAVLSFDVLEHVPDFHAAFGEIARVLKPEGYLIASFPFDTSLAKTSVRASIAQDGSIVHHLPPEYHGDPVDNSGCLCFQVFGWDVLDEIRHAGFSQAYTLFYWSLDRGYLGPNQLLIVGQR
jgi:hypothetical protein